MSGRGERAYLDEQRQRERYGGSIISPVVFLVLPITILFALYPGLLAITAVAQ